MYWKSKPIIQKKPVVPQDRDLVKPSIRPHVPRDKRIEFRLPCFLLVEQTGYLLETTTVNISKSGMLVTSLKPLEQDQEVLCLIHNRHNLTKLHVLNNKNTLRGKIVRVERQELLYRMAVHITFGRINPVAHMQHEGDHSSWWTRHWQGMDGKE